ncbi:MAG: hypothetical protein RPU34_04350 [Candidatus Sedimenticola sp. (ex Thyasira tokunagai)]
MPETSHHTVTAHDQALVYIHRHAAEHLEGDGKQLLERTAKHLQLTRDISIDTARDIAAQAYAEHSARGRDEYIDLNRTTSHCVFLRMPNGQDRCLTARKLAELIA